MHKLQTVTCKIHSSKAFETISNVLKTVSNKFIQLRKLLKMVCTTTISISRCCMSTDMQNTMQYRINSTFQLRNPLKMGRYIREDGNVEHHDKAISTNTYIYIYNYIYIYISVGSKFRCFDQNSCFSYRIQI